jgi:hypothetical protein
MKTKTFLIALFLLSGMISRAQVLSGNLVITPGEVKILYSSDVDECIVSNFQVGCDYISDTLSILVMQKLSAVFENSSLNISYNLDPIKFDTLPFTKIVINHSAGAKMLKDESIYYYFGKFGIPLCSSNLCFWIDKWPNVNKNYKADITKLTPKSDYNLVLWTIYHSIYDISGTKGARATVIYDLFNSKTGEIVFEEAINGGTSIGSVLYQDYIEKAEQMPAYNDLMEYTSYQIVDNFMKKYNRLEKEIKKKQQ